MCEGSLFIYVSYTKIQQVMYSKDSKTNFKYSDSDSDPYDAIFYNSFSYELLRKTSFKCLSFGSDD